MIVEAGEHEDLLTAEIDLDEVDRVRRAIPIFEDRRPDAYLTAEGMDVNLVRFAMTASLALRRHSPLPGGGEFGRSISDLSSPRSSPPPSNGGTEACRKSIRLR